MRHIAACYLLLACLPLTTFAGDATADDATGQATQLVDQLLAMPTAAEDPQGRMNAERWQLARDIGAMGDEAIPVLESARSSAKTALQRHELTDALADIRTPAGTKALLALAADKDDDIRGPAINGLAGRAASPIDKGGSDDILPLLAKLAPDEKVEMNRLLMCNAMRAAIKPAPPADKPDDQRIALAIGMLRDRLKNDSSQDIRFSAACILTEFGDDSGREELKKTAIDLEAKTGPDEIYGALDQLVPAIERVTGKQFGQVPMNPMIASDTRTIPALKARRRALAEKIADWAKNDPTTQAATAP